MQNNKDIEQQKVTDTTQQFEMGVDYYKERNGKKQDRSKAVIEPSSLNIDSTSSPRHYPIFISYKRVDKETVFSLKDKIEGETGQKCWIDLDGIESDHQFANVIINAINNAETILFMYSKAHSLIEHYENDWTIRELNFAQDKEKRIVFVNIDKSPLTDWFKLMFGTKQQVDATSDYAIGRLLEDLKAWTNIKGDEQIITTVKNEYKEKFIHRVFQWGKHHKIITFSMAFVSIVFFLFFLFLNSSLVEMPFFHRLHIWKKRYFNPYEHIGFEDVSTGVLYGVHNAVDLGLSVKWSTTNVGADLPHDFGDYYSWGEITTKLCYDWDDYAFGNDTCITKYCVDDKYGTIDNLNQLTEDDDVVAVKWKNGWRMPTYEEFTELRTKCTFEVCTLLGQDGYLLTGPNGNTIFFPLAGEIDGTSVSGKNSYVIYWTSSLFGNNTEAYEFAMSKERYYWYNSPRYTGHNIRAVHE